VKSVRMSRPGGGGTFKTHLSKFTIRYVGPPAIAQSMESKGGSVRVETWLQQIFPSEDHPSRKTKPIAEKKGDLLQKNRTEKNKGTRDRKKNAHLRATKCRT